MKPETKQQLTELKEVWVSYWTEGIQKSKKRKKEINLLCFQWCKESDIQFHYLHNESSVRNFVTRYLEKITK